MTQIVRLLASNLKVNKKHGICRQGVLQNLAKEHLYFSNIPASETFSPTRLPLLCKMLIYSGKCWTCDVWHSWYLPAVSFDKQKVDFSAREWPSCPLARHSDDLWNLFQSGRCQMKCSQGIWCKMKWLKQVLTSKRRCCFLPWTTGTSVSFSKETMRNCWMFWMDTKCARISKRNGSVTRMKHSSRIPTAAMNLVLSQEAMEKLKCAKHFPRALTNAREKPERLRHSPELKQRTTRCALTRCMLTLRGLMTTSDCVDSRPDLMSVCQGPLPLCHCIVWYVISFECGAGVWTIQLWYSISRRKKLCSDLNSRSVDLFSKLEGDNQPRTKLHFFPVVLRISLPKCQGPCKTSTSLTDGASYLRIILLNSVNRNKVSLLRALKANIPWLTELVIVLALVVDNGSAEKNHHTEKVASGVTRCMIASIGTSLLC